MLNALEWVMSNTVLRTRCWGFHDNWNTLYLNFTCGFDPNLSVNTLKKYIKRVGNYHRQMYTFWPVISTKNLCIISGLALSQYFKFVSMETTPIKCYSMLVVSHFTSQTCAKYSASEPCFFTFQDFLDCEICTKLMLWSTVAATV